ncbi:MAG: hypothetical protein FWD61_15810 [Phycisphaerales bacterium]|nr:hypothetical protein [Phycisphaerales bacterium]
MSVPNPPPNPRQPRFPRGARITLGCFGTIVLLFILFCSGLNFPVIFPHASFAHGIDKDFNVTIPPSLKVLHAARLAMRDPAYYYECQLPPAEVRPFMQQIEAAAKTVPLLIEKAEDRFCFQPQPLNRFSYGPTPPAWYNPASLPDRQEFFIRLTNDSAGYWFFFSPSTGKIYVFWYET